MEKKLKKKEESTSKIIKFIREEHKFENWLLFILSIMLLIISLYIFIAAVGSDDTTSTNVEFAKSYFDIGSSGWAIGDYYLFDKPWKVIVMSSVIIAISLAALLYCIWPVVTPSFKDLKFVSWTDKRTLFINSLTVILFIAFLTLVFYVFSIGIGALFTLIFGE